MVENKKDIIGGLLNGLWDFIKVLEEMERKGKSEVTKIGEVKGPQNSRIAYQYRVRTITGDKEFKPTIGIRPKQKVIKAVGKPKEPLIDVFDKGDHISIIASLPGVKEEDLELKIVNNVLRITANTAESKIERDVSVPEGSRVNKIEEVSFKNGILKIKLSKKGGE